MVSFYSNLANGNEDDSGCTVRSQPLKYTSPAAAPMEEMVSSSLVAKEVAIHVAQSIETYVSDQTGDTTHTVSAEA